MVFLLMLSPISEPDPATNAAFYSAWSGYEVAFAAATVLFVFVATVGYVAKSFGCASNSGWIVSNYPYRLVATAADFFRFLFDISSYDIAPLDLSDNARKKLNMGRGLHWAWHSVVFVPVVVVCVVAYVLKAPPSEVMFFGSLATGTVSLEICIGIILSKVSHLEDLSRQVAHICTDENREDFRQWIDYFQRRHHAGRVGVAKAALVTTISVVLFSSIVGVETMRMQSHIEPTVERISPLLKSNTKSEPKELAALVCECLHHPSVNKETLLTTAASLASCLFLISTLKLWIQTRESLERRDPIDRFESAEDAITSLEQSHIAHLIDSSAKMRTRESANPVNNP